jgi:hypothetical protein
LPAKPHYDQFDANDYAVLRGAELYSNGTLFHGARFQGIDKVLNISDKKLTLLCHAVDVDSASQGQFPIATTNPFSDDLLYQSMLVWARHIYKAGSLPSSCRQLEQFTVLQAGQSFYLSLDVISHSSSNLVADITVHNSEGEVYSRMLGGEVTISESLNKLFQRQ